MNPILETVDVQGHLTLLALVDRLVVLVAVDGALPAVPPLGMTFPVKFVASNPVVDVVKPKFI
jgi:hypothetical protein